MFACYTFWLPLLPVAVLIDQQSFHRLKCWLYFFDSFTFHWQASLNRTRAFVYWAQPPQNILNRLSEKEPAQRGELEEGVYALKLNPKAIKLPSNMIEVDRLCKVGQKAQFVIITWDLTPMLNVVWRRFYNLQTMRFQDYFINLPLGKCFSALMISLVGI